VNTTLEPKSSAWLDQVQEEIIDPDRRIIDPHHHLWSEPLMFGRYELEDLWADTGSGHNIEKTVFIDCHANYRVDGPGRMKPIGETEYVAKVAAASRDNPEQATIAAIVSHANLLLGDEVEEILHAHEDAGQGLFRGIRHAGPYDDTGALANAGGGRPCPYQEVQFQQGLRRLAAMGYSYDTWHFHMQNAAFLALAQAVPEATMVLDHFGTPLGVGPYADRREEIFAQWCEDIAAIAQCPNVYAKLGGLAMIDNGFGWHAQSRPPTSDEFVAAQRRYYEHAIECFGPQRCMFESNFPVDRLSIAYPVLWNGLKKIAAQYSESEQDAMFYGTAAQVYKV
tara:strand:- start:1221 stop:2234 length:1014 start_codon:yes stop_codon:yes gene_type:complete